MIHRANPDWGTHIPVLIKALQQTSGSVLELGLGISSTPLLHALCHDKNRMLVSLEHDPLFVDMFKKYRNPKHKIELVENWDNADILNEVWSVVLVDHKPDERRKVEIERLKDNAVFLIVHDTQPEATEIFGYDKIYPLFKYISHFGQNKTHTTVLSNLKEFYE